MRNANLKILAVSVILLCQIAHSQGKRNPKHEKTAPAAFKDTIANLAFDSVNHNFGNFPTRDSHRLTKRFKYLDDKPIVIVRAWTTDPHFIYEYPREPLVKGKIYEFSIAFSFQDRVGRFTKSMGFYLSDETVITLNFKGNLIYGPCKLDRLLNMPDIGANVKRAYSNTLSKQDFLADEDLQLSSGALLAHTPPHVVLEGFAKDKQQFNLKAYLNLCRLVRDDLDWSFQFGYGAKDYIQHCTGAFAACYDSSRCLDESDFQLWSEMTIKSLYIDEPRNGIPYDIDKFIVQLKFNVRERAPEIRATIERFSDVLKKESDTARWIAGWKAKVFGK